MNGYRNCPHDECQGTIAPDQIHIANWQRQPRGGKNIFRIIRHHYIWCENCGTAFDLIEDQYSGSITQATSHREKDSPVEAGKIKSHIPAMQLQTVL